MLLLFGVGVLVVVWAMLVAWIAKIAQSRGRIIVGWVIGAAALGALGFLAGLGLIERVVGNEDLSGLTVLASVTPAVFLIGAMLALAFILQRLPIKVSRLDEWPVHFMDRGAGQISIDADQVRFVWADGSRAIPLDQLRRVEADGECLRVDCGEGLELAALPMGKPETPAGRRQQSQYLARRLRASLPSARIRRR